MLIRRLAILSLAILPLSCRDKEEPPRADLVAELCAKIFSCSCEEYPYSDPGQCEESVAAEYDAFAAAAELEGLTFDDACIKSYNDSLIELVCKIESELLAGSDPDASAECTYCPFAYGAVAAGQPCVDNGLLSECARGLQCRDGTCVDPCAPSALGASCADASVPCADGLYCHPDTVRCAQPAEEGEMCDSWSCADGLVCVFDDVGATCRVGAGLGESCDFTECRTELRCVRDPNTDTATCYAPAGEGEPCELVECAGDLFCNPDGMGGHVCGALPKLGEPCTFACEDDAYCDESSPQGVCKPRLGEGEPCQGNQCALGLQCGEQAVCVAEVPMVCTM